MGEVGEGSLRSEKDPILELLPHKLNKMKNFKKVRPEDFNVKQLEKWCSEGKLFVYLEPENNTHMYRREVLDYVERIKDFTTERWKEYVDNLWSAIVEEPCFQDCLMMKNGLQAGHMNKYLVTNLVCRLQNAGVYRQDVSMVSLHLRLERIEIKNKYYKSSGNYDINREAIVFLRKIMQRV